MFHADRQTRRRRVASETERERDVTKLTVDFGNFANAPKNMN